MQIILRPENTYVSEALARSRNCKLHIRDFSVGTFGGLAPHTKKLATLLCVGKGMTPPPPPPEWTVLGTSRNNELITHSK